MYIRFAVPYDLDALKALESHLDEPTLIKKLKNKEILIACNGKNIIGFLRYNMFWDEIPFVSMLFVAEGCRSRGVGSLLLSCWEKHMKFQKFRSVMTSTQANESAQVFYRQLGYADTGSFFPTGEALELILSKKL